MYLVCKGRILENVLTGKEKYLDFDPNAYVDEEGNGQKFTSVPRKFLAPVFEVNVYSEHKELLDKMWQEKFELIVSAFDEYHVSIISECNIFPPQEQGEKNQDLDWQKFKALCIVGRID